MAHVPAELLYTKSHEWVQFTGETTARVGITDFAQNSLGDIVFVNLPAEGDGVTAGEAALRRGIGQGRGRHRQPRDRHNIRRQQ